MFVYNWTDLSRRGLSATVRLSTQTFGLLSHSGRKDYKEDCGFLCSVFNEICSSMESIWLTTQACCSLYSLLHHHLQSYQSSCRSTDWWWPVRRTHTSSCWTSGSRRIPGTQLGPRWWGDHTGPSSWWSPGVVTWKYNHLLPIHCQLYFYV